MYFKNYKEHAIPLFVKSKILPIHILYYKTIGNLMHEINNNSCPSSIVLLIHDKSIIIILGIVYLIIFTLNTQDLIELVHCEVWS